MTTFRRTYAALALLALAATPALIRAESDGLTESWSPPAAVATAGADTTAAIPLPATSAAPTPAPRATDYFLPPPPTTTEGVGGAGAAVRARDRAGYSYNYSVYDGRYDDTITSVDLYKPLGAPHAKIRPYVAVSTTKDSRTSSGSAAPGQVPVPLVFSDNYAVAAAGLQYSSPSGLRIFAQGGVSTKIGPVAAQPSGGDARGGVQYYHDFGIPDRPHGTSGNVYAGLTYYSRYSDAVLYAQGERVANLGGGRRPVEAFARATLSLDSKSFYYSNLVEATAGVRWRPLGTTGPTISVEQVSGRYVRGAVRPAGVPASYADFRPTISLGFSL